MADDFDNDDFDDVVDNVKRGSTWMRIVFMIGFCIVLYVVSVVIWFLTGAQALFSIFTGSDNRNLRHLGAGLAEYVNQILRFITYNSEMRPFPFSPFPIGEEADSEMEEDADDDSPESEPAGAERQGGETGSQFDDLAFLSRQDETGDEEPAEAQEQEPTEEPGYENSEENSHQDLAPDAAGESDGEDSEQKKSDSSSQDRADNETRNPG